MIDGTAGDNRTSHSVATPALTVAAATVATTAAVLALSHAFGIPYADDWAYARIAHSLEATGHLHFIGWNDVSLVGHLVWAVPWIAVLGPGIATVHLAGATAAFIGLLGTASLFGRFLPARLALLGAATVAVSPFYVLLTGTYMTDIPAFAAEMWCLSLGIAWLRSDRLGWASALSALAIGIYGFTVRESALAAPAAVLIGALIERKSARECQRVLALGLVVAATLFAFYIWRASLATPDFSRSPQLRVGADIEALCRAAMVVGLVALPVAIHGLVEARTKKLPRNTVTIAAAAALAAALVPLSQVWYHGRPETIFTGNILTRVGALGDGVLSGARPELFPIPAWVLIQLGAVVGAFVVFAAALQAITAARGCSFPRGTTVVAAYVALSLAGFAGRSDTVAPLYDRYLLGVGAAAVLLVLITSAGRRVRIRAGIAALALPLVVSLVLLTDSSAYLRARWDAADAAVASGLPPNAVDAGFEWVGQHHVGTIGDSSASAATRDILVGAAGSYTLAFGDAPCMVVADSPKPDLPLVRVARYRTLAGLVGRKLYVYRIPAVCNTLRRSAG